MDEAKGSSAINGELILLNRKVRALRQELEQLQTTKKRAFGEFAAESLKKARLIEENAALIEEGNRIRSVLLFYTKNLESVEQEIKDKQIELDGIIAQLVARRKDLQQVRESLLTAENKTV